MGYEVKLYVVSEHYYPGIDDTWAEVISMFDLCKVGDRKEYFREDAEGYIYADDGNTRITEDRYGDTMKVETLDRAIEFLWKSYSESFYWRCISACELITSIRDKCDTRDNLKVYWFGH